MFLKNSDMAGKIGICHCENFVFLLLNSSSIFIKTGTTNTEINAIDAILIAREISNDMRKLERSKE